MGIENRVLAKDSSQVSQRGKSGQAITTERKKLRHWEPWGWGSESRGARGGHTAGGNSKSAVVLGNHMGPPGLSRTMCYTLTLSGWAWGFPSLASNSPWDVLILCVNLSGSGGALTFDLTLFWGMSVRVFPEENGVWTSRQVESRLPSPVWVGLI